MRRILHKKFPWTAISRRVRKEQKNRETYSPTISTYRWWARRSHSLIGALIDRAQVVLGSEIVVSDPMSGGGTVAIEAARRGLSVYAQDINPWAAFGLQTTLQPVNASLVEEAAQKFVGRLERAAASLYRTSDGEEIVTQLHVRTLRCPSCKERNYLYPTRLIALEKRVTQQPTSGWFGCPACGSVHCASWPKGRTRCPSCRYRFGSQPTDEKRIVRRTLVCAHCGDEATLNSADLDRADWSPALTIVSAGKTLRIRTPEVGSPVRGKVALALRMEGEIPAKGETAALRSGGFRTWRELFPERQLALLNDAVTGIDEIDDAPEIKKRLFLAVAGFAEMAGYACRWDPKYRKVYEVTANHHYSRVLLAAETNPIASLGRGTLKRRLGAAVAAAHWLPGSEAATVTCGSSKSQPIPSRSVDLVITDPPYYDSIQYAELSRLFRSFSSALGADWPDDFESGEAVASRTLNCSHEEYVLRLTDIFRETLRTLKEEGRMILTFHHHRIKAWEAMGKALRDAGWQIVSVGVVHSENEKDFAKNTKNVITVDAVFECMRRTPLSCRRVTTSPAPRDTISRNVLAMGSAVAGYVNRSEGSLGPIYLKCLALRRIRKAVMS